MPGKADSIAVIMPDGSKETVQRRHMVMTIGEAYKIFLTYFPDIQCGKSRFAELRPPYVLLVSKTPQNVCGCKYHSNVFLLLECLNRKFPGTFPRYEKEAFLGQCVCNLQNETCMSNACDLCQDGSLFEQNFANKLTDEAKKSEMRWDQWMPNSTGYIEKRELHGTVEDMLLSLNDQLPRFTWHVFIKDKQPKSYQNDKEEAKSSDSDLCMGQMDYSENWTSMYQDEVQSAHWHKEKISVYTVMLWHREITKSWVIVSDCLDHSKKAVVAFLISILEFTKKTMPSVKMVKMWTDGAASQFKNKYVFAFLVVANNIGFEISWSFHPTSHGKGPSDALGGTAKRMVARQILSRRGNVRDAKGFQQVISRLSSIIRCTEVTPQEIEDACSELKIDTIWESVPAMPGTLNTHFVQPHLNSVECKFYDTAQKSTIHQLDIQIFYSQVSITTQAASETEPPASGAGQADIEARQTASGTGQAAKKRKRSNKTHTRTGRKETEPYPCPRCLWAYGDTRPSNSIDVKSRAKSRNHFEKKRVKSRKN